MRCYICGKTYYIKRNIKTLFKDQHSYRCLRCDKKYKLSLNYQVIPKQNGSFHIISLFHETNHFDLTAFNDEISALIEKIIHVMQRKDTFLWIDELNETLLAYLDDFGCDLYIVTNYIYL